MRTPVKPPRALVGRKILVASVGVAAVSYACGGVTSDKRGAPLDGTGGTGGTGGLPGATGGAGNLMPPPTGGVVGTGGQGAVVDGFTSGNLMPPPTGGVAGTGGTQSGTGGNGFDGSVLDGGPIAECTPSALFPGSPCTPASTPCWLTCFGVKNEMACRNGVWSAGAPYTCGDPSVDGGPPIAGCFNSFSHAVMPCCPAEDTCIGKPYGYPGYSCTRPSTPPEPISYCACVCDGNGSFTCAC